MKRKFVFCWLLLASSMLSGFFSGCGGGGSDSSLLDELIRNRSLWQSQRLSSYSLEYTETCFCALSSQQVHVVVEDAVVVQAQINQNGTTVDVELSQVRSIDGLFDYIIQIEKLNPDFISIEYDPVYGYPRRFSADLSQTLVDDEVSWEVSLNVINNRSCGPVDCPAGLQCCNSSCGICTLPGGACIQIACLQWEGHIPIYLEDMEYKLSRGFAALDNRLEELGVSELLRCDRVNTCEFVV